MATARVSAIANLSQLPAPVLLDIFQYLRLQDVPSVACSCRKFRAAFYGPGSEMLWRRVHANSCRPEPLLQLLPPVCDCQHCRRRQEASSRDAIRQSLRWQRRRHWHEVTVCHFGRRQRLMPSVQLHWRRLYYTRANCVFACDLPPPFADDNDDDNDDDDNNKERGVVKFVGAGDSDVTAISGRGRLLLAGTADGAVAMWPTEYGGRRRRPLLLRPLEPPTPGRVADVDWLTDSCALIGCREGSVRALAAGWASESGELALGQAPVADCGDRVYCARAFGRSSALIGCAGLAARPLGQSPLCLLDVGDRLGRVVRRLADAGLERRGSGVRGVAAVGDSDSTSCCLSVGYDATLRLWDLRLPRARVASWDDPHDCAGTSVVADANAAVVGLQQHGLVRLFDLRLRGPGACVASYYKGAHCPDRRPRLVASPVYSLAATPHCFVRAVDSEINCVYFC